jgi:hypothetical protein
MNFATFQTCVFPLAGANIEALFELAMGLPYYFYRFLIQKSQNTT